MGIFDSLFWRTLHAPAERGGGGPAPRPKRGEPQLDTKSVVVSDAPPPARSAGAPRSKLRHSRRPGKAERAALGSAPATVLGGPDAARVGIPETGMGASEVRGQAPILEVAAIGGKATETVVVPEVSNPDLDELTSLFSQLEQEAEEAVKAVVTKSDAEKMAVNHHKVSDWLARVEESGADLYVHDQANMALIRKQEQSRSEGLDNNHISSKRTEIAQIEKIILTAKEKVAQYTQHIDEAMNSEGANSLRTTLEKYRTAIDASEERIKLRHKEIQEILGDQMNALTAERVAIETDIQKRMTARMDRYRAILDAIDKDPSFIQFTEDLKQKEDERRKEEEKLAQVARDNNDKARRELDATMRNERRQELARGLDNIDRTATSIEKACEDAMKRLDNILVKLSKEESAQGEIILLRKAFPDYQEKASDTSEQQKLIVSLQKRIGTAVQRSALGFNEIQQIVPWLSSSRFSNQFSRLDSPDASQIIKQAKKQGSLIPRSEQAIDTKSGESPIRGAEKLKGLIVSNQSDSVEYTEEEKKAISALYDHADKVGNHRGLAIQLKQFLARLLPITREQNRHGSSVLVGDLAEYIKKVQAKQAPAASVTVVKDSQKPPRATANSPLPPAPRVAVGVKESGPISPAPQQPAAGSSGPDRSRGGNQPNKGGSGGRKGGGGSQGGSKGGGRREGGRDAELGQGDKFDKRTITGGARGGETGRLAEKHKPNEVYTKGSNLAVELLTYEANGNSIGGHIEFCLAVLTDPDSKEKAPCIQVVSAHGFDHTSLKKWFGNNGKGTERLYKGLNVIPLRSLELNPVKLTAITDYVRKDWNAPRQPKASGGTTREQAGVGFVNADREQDPDIMITNPELQPIKADQLPDQPVVIPEVREAVPLTENPWVKDAGDILEVDATDAPLIQGSAKKPRKGT